jgi:glucosyl-3-phosphoglycerate synthase
MMLTTFESAQFDPQTLASRKQGTVSVCIPTRETAETIEGTVRAVGGLQRAGLVDQLVVVDADSVDETAAIAQAAGAEAVSEAELMPELGPVRGKGDAMWRALSIIDGDVVVYLDGDVHDFGPHYVTGLLGPLIESAQFDFVKGFYRRPLAIDSIEIEDGGGRVTELTAKPLLEIFLPELAAFRQPLAGECAARRSLLEQIPYATGYGVEIAMLVAVWQRLGLERMAQVGLGSKRNSHQALPQLRAMSREVIEALLAQLAIPSEAALDVRALAGAAQSFETRPPMQLRTATSTAGATDS